MNGKPAILAIEQEPVVRQRLSELMAAEGYGLQAVEDSRQGMEALRNGHFALVLLDPILPQLCPVQAVREIQSIDPDVEIVMLTAFASLETAVAATKAGVFDYLVKPFKNDELLLVIRNGLERRRLTLENQRLRRSLRPSSCVENLVGRSQMMRKVFVLIHQVASRRSHALIRGPVGTGKERVARAIHQLGPNADSPFVTVKTGAIPGRLLERELFGDAGGTPGGVGEQQGLLESARGGTLFLDEAGRLPLQIQDRLLQVISGRCSGLRGGGPNRPPEVCILAATEHDLAAESGRGRFREALYDQLRAIEICLPALRERREDIPTLVRHLLSRLAPGDGEPLLIHSSALKALVDHDWPGNVRELENVLELAVLLARPCPMVRPDHLPSEILDSSLLQQTPEEILRNPRPLKETVADFERSLILAALESNDWNQRRTARVLRTIPTTLNQKIKRLRIRGA